MSLLQQLKLWKLVNKNISLLLDANENINKYLGELGEAKLMLIPDKDIEKLCKLYNRIEGTVIHITHKLEEIYLKD